MQTYSSFSFVIWVFLTVLSSLNVDAQLKCGFYSQSCPLAESIVKQEVMKGYMNNKRIAPGLVRMHFHDCFVRGCDGSVLIDSTSSNTAEKDSSINNPSLQGFEIIDNAKTRLEATCPGVVSCADVLAFAARDGIVITGGPMYDVPAGRRDGTVSLASDVPNNLPAPTLNVSQLTQNFANKGLTQDEMVTLSGAHTIGVAHCTAFDTRLYNFDGTNGADPSLDSKYAAQLQQQCPQGNTNNNVVVPMDPGSPFITDVGYYSDILANRGLFTSDQTLMTDSTTANQVNEYADNQNQWKTKFAAAMVKMGQIEVLTGSAGEIRANCRKV